jgi:hypothetical protein
MGTLGTADKINPFLYPAEANRPSLRVSDSIVNLLTYVLRPCRTTRNSQRSCLKMMMSLMIGTWIYYKACGLIWKAKTFAGTSASTAQGVIVSNLQLSS